MGKNTRTEMTLLQVTMKSIAKKDVKHHFSDIDVDFNIIGNSTDKVFYWLTNHSCTHIVTANQFTSKIDNTVEALLEIFGRSTTAKLYKIVVEERKEGCYYGTIQKVPLVETFEKLINEKTYPKKIGFSWDGQYKEVDIPYSDFDPSEIYRLFKEKVAQFFTNSYDFKYIF